MLYAIFVVRNSVLQMLICCHSNRHVATLWRCHGNVQDEPWSSDWAISSLFNGGLQPSVNRRTHHHRRCGHTFPAAKFRRRFTIGQRPVSESPAPAATPAPGGLQPGGDRTTQGPGLADTVRVRRSERKRRRSNKQTARSNVINARLVTDEDLQFPWATNRLEMLSLPFLRVRLLRFHAYCVLTFSIPHFCWLWQNDDPTKALSAIPTTFDIGTLWGSLSRERRSAPTSLSLCRSWAAELLV